MFELIFAFSQKNYYLASLWWYFPLTYLLHWNHFPKGVFIDDLNWYWLCPNAVPILHRGLGFLSLYLLSFLLEIFSLIRFVTTHLCPLSIGVRANLTTDICVQVFKYYSELHGIVRRTYLADHWVVDDVELCRCCFCGEGPSPQYPTTN